MDSHKQGYETGVRTALALATGDEGLTKVALSATEAMLASFPATGLMGAGIGGIAEESPGAERGMRIGLGTGLGAIGLPLLVALLTKGKVKPGLNLPTAGLAGAGGLAGGLTAAKLTEPEEPGFVDKLRSTLAEVINPGG